MAQGRHPSADGPLPPLYQADDPVDFLPARRLTGERVVLLSFSLRLGIEILFFSRGFAALTASCRGQRYFSLAIAIVFTLSVQ